MTDKKTDRLTRLQQRKAELERQIAAAERDAREAGRKLETRRKIIVGGAILAAIAESPGLAGMVKTVLARRVTRPADRAAIADLLETPTPATPPKTGPG